MRRATQASEGIPVCLAAMRGLAAGCATLSLPDLLKEMEATIIRGPIDGPWAPGYYYVLFEDPDGIRLEVNFVPWAGLLADGAQFNPGTGYV